MWIHGLGDECRTYGVGTEVMGTGHMGSGILQLGMALMVAAACTGHTGSGVDSQDRPYGLTGSGMHLWGRPVYMRDQKYGRTRSGCGMGSEWGGRMGSGLELYSS
jgi:Tfp pilus assembly protein PilV